MFIHTSGPFWCDGGPIWHSSARAGEAAIAAAVASIVLRLIGNVFRFIVSPPNETIGHRVSGLGDQFETLLRVRWPTRRHVRSWPVTSLAAVQHCTRSWGNSRQGRRRWPTGAHIAAWSGDRRRPLEGDGQSDGLAERVVADGYWSFAHGPWDAQGCAICPPLACASQSSAAPRLRAAQALMPPSGGRSRLVGHPRTA